MVHPLEQLKKKEHQKTVKSKKEHFLIEEMFFFLLINYLCSTKLSLFIDSIFRCLQLRNILLKSCEKRSNIEVKGFRPTIDKDEEYNNLFWVL